jgi:hypothetical protein
MINSEKPPGSRIRHTFIERKRSGFIPRKTCLTIVAFAAVTLTTTFACTPSPSVKDITTDSTSVETMKTDLSIERMVAKIRTDVDPAYVYPYKQSKFVPPAGKVLLIMGQDSTTIAEYMENFPDPPAPGGWTAYWGVTSMNGVDRMNADDIAKQFGYQNQQALVDQYPDAVLQSGLWMAGMWDVLKNASQGNYNSVIRQFSVWAKTINRPLYLRIGYEFDGEHNQMDPVDYVTAYRKIVDLMRLEGADNVAFVWQSYAAPTYKGYPLSSWYPGDDYVDWVGISLFEHMYSVELNKEADDVFEFARQHYKPVMIAEASPVQGISGDNTDAWDTWFTNFLSLTYRKNVKAISYINANWSRYPGFASLKWKDARLQNNQLLAGAWFKETGKARYLKQSPDLFEQLGYTK